MEDSNFNVKKPRSALRYAITYLISVTLLIRYFSKQIYNVCDQIAQCEDGSDEGPEVILNKI